MSDDAIASRPTLESVSAAFAISYSAPLAATKGRDLVRRIAGMRPVRQVLVGRQRQKRGHAHVVGEKRPRQGLRDRRAGERIPDAGQGAVRPAAEPAPSLRELRIRRVPDVARREVGEARARIPDVRHDGDASGVPERLHAGHDRIQAQPPVERQDLADRNADPRAELRIERVGVRHDRVQAVVASGELEHDERPPVERGAHGFLEPGRAPDGPARHHRRHRDEARRADQKVAAGEHRKPPLRINVRRGETRGSTA